MHLSKISFGIFDLSMGYSLISSVIFEACSFISFRSCFDRYFVTGQFAIKNSRFLFPCFSYTTGQALHACGLKLYIEQALFLNKNMQAPLMFLNS